MKCPKCGYLGFETIDRCRNCGYDFALSVHVAAPPELILNEPEGPGEPLADFDLTSLATSRNAESATGLDLDQLTQRGSASERPAAGLGSGRSGPPPQKAPALPDSDPVGGLPLFSRHPRDGAEEPFSTPPRVPPPLSVRRAAPDLTRGRRTLRVDPDDEPALELQLEPATDDVAGIAAPPLQNTAAVAARRAGGMARVAAMLIDLVLIGAIDVAIVYLTLAIAGLTMSDAALLPRIPLAAFLLLLNGGYLVAFIAASGQTIGKMLVGIRVMADDGQRVDLAAALLRSGGCALSLLTAGLGYLPAFFAADGRALQDRIAGTRVVRTR
jgi:uncharacterized RDD family membrane protein YckC